MSDTGKKIVLLAAAVVLALGLGEIVLRVIDYGAVTPKMNFGVNTRMSLDKGSFLPDKDLFWKLPVHPLDRQFRSIQPDVAVPPKGKRRRILVMGDSCSKISTAIPPYSVLLEDSLRGQDVEVWNAAVLGYTTWQGRIWLGKQLLAIQPDVAVVYYGWNDHWRATGITDREYAKRMNRSGPRLALLFRKMPDPPPLRVPLDQYRENLQVIVDELEAVGARVILVTAPSNLTREARARILQTHYLVRGDDANALHREYLAAVRDVCAGTKAELLDAAAVFAAAGSPKLLLMRDGIHLTDRGHRLMACLLAARLEPVLAAGAGSSGDASVRVPDTAALKDLARRFMRTDGSRP